MSRASSSIRIPYSEWATASKALSKKVKRLIEDEDTGVHVSAASAWEIATKVRLGKLTWTSTESVESYCIAQGLRASASRRSGSSFVGHPFVGCRRASRNPLHAGPRVAQAFQQACSL